MKPATVLLPLVVDSKDSFILMDFSGKMERHKKSGYKKSPLKVRV